MCLKYQKMQKTFDLSVFLAHPSSEVSVLCLKNMMHFKLTGANIGPQCRRHLDVNWVAAQFVYQEALVKVTAI